MQQLVVYRISVHEAPAGPGQPGLRQCRRVAQVLRPWTDGWKELGSETGPAMTTAYDIIGDIVISI